MVQASAREAARGGARPRRGRGRDTLVPEVEPRLLVGLPVLGAAAEDDAHLLEADERPEFGLNCV
ncbi:MAG: hypothetical protein CMM12_12200 [Rhodospirillaceae bacterium]|nr:hypothetical protein [Rhodospirillaceae bacterium]MAM69507.1 hypothetical protein [Rhodospirillaceae bacterium]MAN25623.1 hypothetical protein [Gemmatimonadota bacterium]